MLGGGPPPKAPKPPHPSSRQYKYYMAAQKAKEAQEKKDAMGKKASDEVFRYKGYSPASSVSSNPATVNTSESALASKEDQDLPVTLYNQGNTCFVNSGRTL